MADVTEVVGPTPYADCSRQAQALAEQGREEDALRIWRRAANERDPSGVAHHNCAVMEERLGRFEAAVASARESIQRGCSGADTWAILARSLQGAGQYEDAEAAYERVIGLRPAMADVHRDFAQLVWMRTGDISASTRWLRQALQRVPGEPQLVAQLARALWFGGCVQEAYALLEDEIGRAGEVSSVMEIAAATAARMLGDHAAALAHAGQAVRASPDNPAAILVLSDAMVALGQADQVANMIERLHERLPLAQQVTARLATIWRLLDDPRYNELYDYQSFVRTYDVQAPPGWRSIETFMRELRQALVERHTMQAHPFDQSVRNGTQTYSNLFLCDHPAIQGLFAATAPCVQSYVSAVGAGGDPFRRRNTGGAKVLDAWSVQQRAGGLHLNHVHQNGWISSVFYVELPKAIGAGGRQGWLKFGEPGIATQPELDPDHFVMPRLGRLVLFPSYCWHGTTPFEGSDTRLTIAFDLVPSQTDPS